MRILELSDAEGAAAICGRAFVHAGDDVIRVECPDREPPWQPADIYLNGGKRRVALDYRNAAGRAAIAAIAARCDVVVTDAPVQDVKSFGLLSLGGEGPLHISITPFGLSGPYRDWQATDATLLALAGHTWLAGDPGRAPLTMPWRYPRYQAGQFAYIAARSELLRAAPQERSRTIEVSMLECLSSLHQGTDTMWTSERVIRSRNGNTFFRGGQMLLPCHDGWYEVSAGQAFWVGFAHMIGRPDFATDPKYATLAGRSAHQREIEQITTDALWDWPVQRIMCEGQEVWRVPMGYVAALGSLLKDEQLAQADFWQPIAGQPELRMPGPAARIVGEPRPPEPTTAPPGSDTEAVLAEVAREDQPASGRKSCEEGSYRPPLAGIRILDLTHIWAGPLVTRILGDLGADVIKVERPTGRGPAEIPNDPKPRPWNRQALFNKLNRNKRSIALDLKHERGRELFLRLVAKADVVIENFSPRAMPNLGLGHDRLRALNPRLIYVAMPAFGLGGPRRDYIGVGTSIEPSSGLTALMGYSDAEPRITAAGVTDPMAGTVGAGAILDAIERRRQTGEGALIELSQQQAGITFIGEYLIERQLTGREPVRLGNGHRVYAPQGVYRCRGEDDWISITARDEREWRALCAVAGRGWERDARFAGVACRRADRAALDEAIEAWTSGLEKWEISRLLQQQGVPAGPVLSAPEWLAEEHLNARGYWVEYNHAEAGRGRWDGSPIRLDGNPGTGCWTPAPLLGEHNAAVLMELEEVDAHVVEALWADGVITDHPPQ
jgi:crotonobetainyl-CoA:carnitine CoA-transferase CaiB-like acyl-CoA transferase